MDSLNLLSELTNLSPAWLALAIVWSLTWKGLSLWRAAQMGQKYWFVAFLLVNTLGILEIAYLFYISKGYKVEIVDETK